MPGRGGSRPACGVPTGTADTPAGPRKAYTADRETWELDVVAIAVFIAGVEPPGGTERLIQDLERERRDSLWLSENMTDLIEEYGIQFVAIRDQEICGSLVSV